MEINERVTWMRLLGVLRIKTDSLKIAYAALKVRMQFGLPIGIVADVDGPIIVEDRGDVECGETLEYLVVFDAFDGATVGIIFDALKLLV